MSVQDPVEEREVRELFARVRVDERPAFRSDLRSRLLAQVGPVATARHSTPWWAIRIPRFALAGVAALAMLFGATGLAAAGSLPGEPLFELKRAAEEIALVLAFDDETRVQRLADQASARLAELRRADGPGKSAAAFESARAMGRLTEAQRAGGTGAPASENAADAREQAEAVLRDLEQRLPAEAADGIRRALEAGRPADRGPVERDTPRPESPRQEPSRRSDPPGRSDRSADPPRGRDR